MYKMVRKCNNQWIRMYQNGCMNYESTNKSLYKTNILSVYIFGRKRARDQEMVP